MHERAVRKQAARREELAQSAKADTLRLCGELLQANLWAIHKGDRQVTVQNYYTGEDMTIRLDPRLGPNENAQKYFKDYKKKQTAHTMLQKLLVEGEAEIEYLGTVLYEVESAPARRPSTRSAPNSRARVISSTTSSGTANRNRRISCGTPPATASRSWWAATTCRTTS